MNHHDDLAAKHNRRYVLFAIVFALVVLGFAALSISIVALAP